MLGEREEKNNNPPKRAEKSKEDKGRKTPRGNYIGYTP
ncbi:hypothetical protein A2U01_0106063, partial [Trifolium medium]|nr:hypothetical protein [Trifolium medium]